MNFDTCEASFGYCNILTEWMSPSAHHIVTKWTFWASVQRERPLFDIVVWSKLTIFDKVKTHSKCAQLGYCEPVSCSSLFWEIYFLMLRWTWTNSWGDPVSVLEGPVSNWYTGNCFVVRLREGSASISWTTISYLIYCIHSNTRSFPTQPCFGCSHAFHRI